MIHFECDYNNGCHEKILESLIKTNEVRQSGYGFDEYTISAAEKIRNTIGCPDADVFLLVGGTQTNAVVISALLQQYEGVLAAESGHIGVHEAGAIEFTGHKVLTIPGHDGKICSAELQKYLKTFYEDGSRDHMVFPGLVYISYPTELGTLYTKEEMKAIHAVCKEYDIPLYVDGARLGYGLASSECDMTIKEFAQLCDVFYIGGTKVGALCGEAVVFPNGNAPKQFFTIIKQKGALLAKGRVLGIQFDTLFTDDLYMKIARNAIEKAETLNAILEEKGYKYYLKTPTNQQFLIVENSKLDEWKDILADCFWCAGDDDEHTVIRFCTSWATTDEDIETLKKIL